MGWRNTTQQQQGQAWRLRSVHQQLPSRGLETADMPEVLSFSEGTWSCDVFQKAYNLSEKNSCQGSIEWKMWLGVLQAVADRSSCSTAGRPIGGHMKLRTVVSRLLTPPSLPTLKLVCWLWVPSSCENDPWWWQSARWLSVVGCLDLDPLSKLLLEFVKFVT